jgi:putative transposase
MAASLKLFPGNAIRWQDRWYLVLGCDSLDAVIARQPGKRRVERIPIGEIQSDHPPGATSRQPPDLTILPEDAWQVAAKRFEILQPLLKKDGKARTFAQVKKVARVLGKHPATVYRWLEAYKRSERLSVFLRSQRSDRGKSRLPSKLDRIIDAAINKIYLKAEKPDMAAVIEEVYLQCFKSKIEKRPAGNTIRARIRLLADRHKVEERDGKKRAAEKYEPIKGHFPGADFPLAVAQIDRAGIV